MLQAMQQVQNLLKILQRGHFDAAGGEDVTKSMATMGESQIQPLLAHLTQAMGTVGVQPLSADMHGAAPYGYGAEARPSRGLSPGTDFSSLTHAELHELMQPDMIPPGIDSAVAGMIVDASQSLRMHPMSQPMGAMAGLGGVTNGCMHNMPWVTVAPGQLQAQPVQPLAKKKSDGGRASKWKRDAQQLGKYEGWVWVWLWAGVAC